MAEDIFYDSPNVKVTNARFIVGNQTYAMNGVTSVKDVTVRPSHGGAIVAILVGLALLLAPDTGTKICGPLVIGLGIFLIVKAKPEHIVILHSASGETQALTSTDRQFIHDVMTAINDALIHRG